MSSAPRHLLEVVDDELWARRSAEIMAASISSAVERRGRCLLALSGGSSPLAVFDELSAMDDVPWADVIILQTDERIAAADNDARNLAAQCQRLGHLGARWLPLPVDRLVPNANPTDANPTDANPTDANPTDANPTDAATDTDPTDPDATIDSEAVLSAYGDELCAEAGDPPVLDLAHLGLGSDGHTASLIPGDPAVGEMRRFVTMTEPYQSGETTTRRLTLTRPVLDRSRMVLWLVSGASKGPMLKRLLDGDMSIPAGLVHPAHSVVVADRSAARAVHGDR